MNRTIGFSTTIPVEVIIAAGDRPVDLNNVFITDPAPQRFVELAEQEGYPRSMCNWIKGIYGVVREQDAVNAVIVVTQGDCSNALAMMETLELRGVETIPFGFPYNRDHDLLNLQIEKLIEELGTTMSDTLAVRNRLKPLREKLKQLDELTWHENVVTGKENHLWLVSSSDFNGDPEQFERELDAFIKEARNRTPRKEAIRLAFIGIPPIFTDFYDYLEAHGARVVFNEIQRQFSMPFETDDFTEQYLRYTYPYDIFTRIEDIKTEIERRNVDAIIHYVQSFCHRQIEDMILKEKIRMPIITIEGERPGPLDARTKLRIDNFLEMLG